MKSRRMNGDEPIRFDAALDAILALEEAWRSHDGRLSLSDLGVAPLRLVRSRGHAALPPERWRRYPGVARQREKLEGV